jgi:dienelactone hydrolase
MRWCAVALLAVLASPAALAGTADAIGAPAAARQSLVLYLDALAEPPLAARAAALKELSSRAAAERRQGEVRKNILALIGGLPDRSAPLNARITGWHESEGVRIETVVFDSLPGYRVTADLFIPAGKGPFPAILVSPGHGPTGKASNYQFAADFARAGFVVLSYDIVGEGERLEHFDPELNASRLERPTAEHSLAAYQAMLVGQPVVRFFINDAMRGIDYLESRPEVDRTRIGAFGCSGGGAVTAYVAALDPRLKATASACFVTTMHHLLSTIGPQEGEQSTPSFTAAGLDLADWVELAAPKPYAIVSTTEDMFPFAGAREAHDEARHFWSLFGAAGKLQWITGPGGHGHLGPIASDIVGFFVANLQNGGAKPKIVAARPSRPEDILVTSTGQLTTSIGTKTIQTLAQARAAEVAAKPARIGNKKDLAVLRQRLCRDIRQVTHASAQPGSKPPVAEIVKTETRNGYRIETLHFRPVEGPAFDGTLATPEGAVKGRLLYLDRTSAASARIDGLVKTGWQVLALVPAIGSSEDSKAAVLGDFTLLALRAMLVDRTVTGLRIDQAMAAADWLTAKSKTGPLAIYGAGTLGPVALHTAVLDERFTLVVTDGSLAAYGLAVEAPITRNLPEIALPSVLLHYDLPDLVSALAPRRVVMIDPVDAAGRSLRQGEFESLFAPALQNDAVLNLKERLRWYPYEADGLLQPN